MVALAMLPMLGALAGALVDERVHSGVTVWRSACRASGLALRSVMVFTLELLPCAVIGALAGGLAVLAFAVRAADPVLARHALATHAGCVLAMPVGLMLCALALPLPAMLFAETMLAGLLALVVARGLDVLTCRAPLRR